MVRTSILANEARASAPLGLTAQELIEFKNTEQDIFNFVNKDDIVSAKSKATDLEMAWDKSAARLKAIDSKKWTKIDQSIDEVLSQVRSKSSTKELCKSALEKSMQTMK